MLTHSSTRGLGEATAVHSMREVLGVEQVEQLEQLELGAQHAVDGDVIWT